MTIKEQFLGRTPVVSIGEITVDASIQETHNLEADTTDHAVEEGSDISDNVRPKPRTFSIEAQVSSTPLEVGYPLQTAINGITALFSDDDPVLNAWKELQKYYDNSTLVTIVTSLETLENMALTSVGATRNAATGQVLRFSATAKQVRIVTTQATEALKIAPKTTTGQDKKDEGKKAKKKKPSEKKKTSVAARILDSGKGFFGL